MQCMMKLKEALPLALVLDDLAVNIFSPQYFGGQRVTDLTFLGGGTLEGGIHMSWFLLTTITVEIGDSLADSCFAFWRFT